MASITKYTGKRGPSYRVVIRRKGTRISLGGFATKRSAQKWARKKEIEIDEKYRGEICEGHLHTLSDAIARFSGQHPEFSEENPRLLELSLSSQKNYAFHLRYWIDELGPHKLANISPQQISSCRDTLLNGGRSPSTVNHYLVSLASVYKQAVKKWHWMEESANPLRSVAKVEGAGSRDRFLSQSELDALLQACQESVSDYLYPMVMLALTTGARSSETRFLRWEQVDLKRRVIILHETKNRDKRSLPIVDEVAELLGALKTDGRVFQLSGYVFPSRICTDVDGNATKPVDVCSSFRYALKCAGIDDFKWHDLRHSCASFMAMNGATLPEIGAVLGHRSAASTKRYSHLTEQHQHSLVHATMRKVLSGGRDDD